MGQRACALGVAQQAQASRRVVAVLRAQAVGALGSRQPVGIVIGERCRVVVPVGQAGEPPFGVVGVGHAQVARQRQPGAQAARVVFVAHRLFGAAVAVGVEIHLGQALRPVVAVTSGADICSAIVFYHRRAVARQVVSEGHVRR
ncbi:MAG: hypothetical protein M5U05_18390 [Anaerolineales bacterium]|nr:hypothetical protein [Anaerolineales bacterium]